MRIVGRPVGNVLVVVSCRHGVTSPAPPPKRSSEWGANSGLFEWRYQVTGWLGGEVSLVTSFHPLSPLLSPSLSLSLSKICVCRILIAEKAPFHSRPVFVQFVLSLLVWSRSKNVDGELVETVVVCGVKGQASKGALLPDVDRFR